MIVRSSAIVEGDTVLRSTFGATGMRRPFLTTARTTCGSISDPPLATELTAAAICSGVTPTWYPMDIERERALVHPHRIPDDAWVLAAEVRGSASGRIRSG